MEPISEKLSENTRHRGRPKSLLAKGVNGVLEGFVKEGCWRTKINDAYGLGFLYELIEADADDFKAVMGATQEEMEAGGRRFPTGYRTAATEIGRYMEGLEIDRKEIAHIVADARRSGIPFARIAEHFRSLRLGKRQGSPIALAKAIVRTINDYQRRFPGTTVEQVQEAIKKVNIDTD
jgi:hypothetical protein